MSFVVYPRVKSSLPVACAIWAGRARVHVCERASVCVFCLLPQALGKVCSTFVYCLCLCIWNESKRRPGFSQSIMGSSVQLFCSFQAPLISIFLSSNLKKREKKKGRVAHVHSALPIEGSPCKSTLHFSVAAQNVYDRGRCGTEWRQVTAGGRTSTSVLPPFSVRYCEGHTERSLSSATFSISFLCPV